MDLRPYYVDNSVNVPSGESKTFIYRMIYLYKDEQAGSWSDEVSIAVTGE